CKSKIGNCSIKITLCFRKLWRSRTLVPLRPIWLQIDAGLSRNGQWLTAHAKASQRHFGSETNFLVNVAESGNLRELRKPKPQRGTRADSLIQRRVFHDAAAINDQAHR